MKFENLAAGYQLIEEIHTGGSERRFFRCVKNSRNFILIYDQKIVEYARLLKHLRKTGVGVPRLYLLNERKNFAVVEDLGKNSLYKLVHSGKNIRDLYQLAIDELIKLQVDGFSRDLVGHHYDYEHIRWEQEYFSNFFLHQYCRLPKYRLKNLTMEFEGLALQIVTETEPIAHFLMHRDYQSQNIYIKNGQCRIIDFQSARIGPLTYDLAALLRDAYVNISCQQEKEFINYYFTQLKRKRILVERQQFLRCYLLTGLQRNMQALGAFANLSLNKNKPHFSAYVPRGLRLLKSALSKTKLIALSKVVGSIYKNVISNS